MSDNWYDECAKLVAALHYGGSTPLFISEPGRGKSAFTKWMSQLKDVAGIVRIALSSMERTDTLGLPEVREMSLTVNGVERRIKATDNTTPAWVIEANALAEANPGKRVIVFVDELMQAPPDVAATYLIVIDEKVMPNGVPLASNVYFAGAGNDPKQIHQGYPLSPAMSNRLVHLDFDPPLTDWLPLFADNFGKPMSDEEADLRASLAGLFYASPELLETDMATDDLTRGWVSFRSVDRLASSLWRIPGDYSSDGFAAKRRNIIGGLGEAKGMAVLAHLRKPTRIPPEELAANPSLLVGKPLSLVYSSVLTMASWTLRARDTDRKEYEARARAAWNVMNLVGDKMPSVGYALYSDFSRRIAVNYGMDPKVWKEFGNEVQELLN